MMECTLEISFDKLLYVFSKVIGSKRFLYLERKRHFSYENIRNFK